MVSVLKRKKKQPENTVQSREQLARTVQIAEADIPVGDPLEAFLISVGRPVEVSAIDLKSTSLDRLRAEGVQLIVPLVAQNELLGAMYLGARLSDQPYSTDDRKLLANLASQVAPQMQVARLVREQQAEAKEREKIQQELEVAALIQHTLLPKEVPDRLGWKVDAFYRPARSVGGDFYDFIDLDDGRLGVAIGDVTDKGVPAAMVMATCRSMLRAAAIGHSRPGEVLADVNNLLVEEIPPAMFVTCLYAIIDTATGAMELANAGHNLPYVRTDNGVTELRATGMPLGLMKDMDYEERYYTFDQGDVMVLTSDGITEAHDPAREMYGFSRLLGRVAAPAPDGDVLGAIVSDVERHTGPTVEQEDDITLVVVSRVASAVESAAVFEGMSPRQIVAEFQVPSAEGNERIAIDRLVESAPKLELPEKSLERLKTAVGETVMNAIEHGNEFQEDLNVGVVVETTPRSVFVRVSDHGESGFTGEAEAPDLDAKVAGEQTPRGWGLFLIGQMVDQVNSASANGTNVVELVMHREES